MITSDPPPVPPAPIKLADGTGTGCAADRAELPPMSRKTRLPNLTECHSCGFRINASCGQDRLQSLSSEWRIVLLCGKCYGRCVRGDMCTYCLGEFYGDDEKFKCGDCCRCVHRDCVISFSEYAPWSYFDWRSSSVCVDCWLPSKVKKLRDVKMRRTGSDVCGSTTIKKVIEGSGKDLAEKKAQLVVKPRMALQDKVEPLCNAMVGKSGVGKENGGVDYAELGQKGNGVDDAELAIHLHRVINSSPRILSNPKSSSISLVNTLKRQARAGINVSSVDKSPVQQSNCLEGEGCHLPVDKGADSKDDGVEGILKEGQGSCSNNSVDSESFSWKDLDLPKPELKFTYVDRKSRLNVGKRHDQYMFKYSRKRTRLMEVAAREYTYLYDRRNSESVTSSAAIALHSSNDLENIPDSSILASPVSIRANKSSQIRGQEGYQGGLHIGT